eukprot:4141056-Amphidinium_carterae.1
MLSTCEAECFHEMLSMSGRQQERVWLQCSSSKIMHSSGASAVVAVGLVVSDHFKAFLRSRTTSRIEHTCAVE